jgi:hypothetical protein
MRGVFFFIFVLSLTPNLEGAESVRSNRAPRVESILGENVTPAYSKDGLRNLSRGQGLAIGEELRTSEKSSVRIVFPSGTEVILGPGTRAGLLSVGSEADWLFLRSGTLKIKAPSSAQIGIKSRTLVAGLNGARATLNVTSDERLAQIAVHQGAVQIGADTKQFASTQRRVKLGAGQFTMSSREGLQKTRKLDEKSFQAALKKRAPNLIALENKHSTSFAGLSLVSPRAPASVPKKKQSRK